MSPRRVNPPAGQPRQQPLRLRHGIVTSVDRRGTITVDLDGAAQTVPRDAVLSGTPVFKGDTVQLVESGPDLLVVARVPVAQLPAAARWWRGLTTQSVADNADVDLALNTLMFTDASAWVAWNQEQSAFVVHRSCLAAVTAGITWAANKTGDRRVSIRVTAGPVLADLRVPAPAGACALNISSGPLRFTSGNRVTIRAQHTSGGTLTISPGRWTFGAVTVLRDLG